MLVQEIVLVLVIERDQKTDRENEKEKKGSARMHKDMATRGGDGSSPRATDMSTVGLWGRAVPTPSRIRAGKGRPSSLLSCRTGFVTIE